MVHRRHCDSLIMKRPLALTGEGFHFAWVKAFLTALILLGFAAPVMAQTVPEDDVPEAQDRGSNDRAPFILDPPVELLPAPDLPPDVAGPERHRCRRHFKF